MRLRSRFALCCQLLFLLLCAGCSASQPPPGQPFTATDDPGHLFVDDGTRQSLLAATKIHRQYLAGLPPSYQAQIDGKSYPRDWLVQSLDAFIGLIEGNLTPGELSRRLRRDFDIIEAGSPAGRVREMLVTGYYEPLFAGSINPEPPYLFPLYRLPPSLVTREEAKSGHTMVGRLGGDGRFTPFWTRAEIDGDARPLAGHELVYLSDPFEAFLLHVQGSGKIVLPDGSQRAVQFAGHNGHGYKSIGRLLVAEGRLTLEECTVPAIRRYLDNNPGQLQRVLHHNPRYIFFAWRDEEPLRGSLGLPLTAGRSVAIDRRTLPDTLFGWLETSVPEIDQLGNITAWRPSGRFVLPQDSGAAIKGPGRVDLFWGSGAYAETAAGSMRQKGRLYFFIKKGFAKG